MMQKDAMISGPTVFPRFAGKHNCISLRFVGCSGSGFGDGSAKRVLLVSGIIGESKCSGFEAANGGEDEDVD